MGFSPRHMDRISLAEYAAMMDGWNRSHGSDDKPEAMDENDFEQMVFNNTDWINRINSKQ